MCDHVFIISKGNLVASDSMEHLESRMSGAQQLEVIVQAATEQMEGLKQIDGVKECKIVREVLLNDSDEKASEEKELHLSVIAQEGRDIRASVFGYCAANQLVLLEMRTNTKTLEDVFLELTRSEEVYKA